MSYHAYTGVGSRKTPEHILKIMHHIGAYLFTEGWTLRSGAADGADKAFELGANEAAEAAFRPDKIQLHVKEIYLPWKGFNHSISDLHPEKIPFTQQEIDLSALAHPAWARCTPSVRLLHQRNMRQLIGCEALHGPDVIPSKFVVCWTENGSMKGGTSQALRIAEQLNIPVINLGKAKSAQELEAMVLEVDRLQKEFKPNE